MKGRGAPLRPRTSGIRPWAWPKRRGSSNQRKSIHGDQENMREDEPSQTLICIPFALTSFLFESNMSPVHAICNILSLTWYLGTCKVSKSLNKICNSL